MTSIFPYKDSSYRRDPEENWFPREDVAGYEYTGEGDHYRIGIVREVIQRPDDLAPLFDILNTPFTESITINMARVVLTKELLQHPPDHLKPSLATDIETIISLEDSGNGELRDCYQVVFSRHHPSRQTSQKVALKELATAEKIFATAKANPLDPALLSQFKQAYTFERITAASNLQLRMEYEQLTKATFGYTHTDVDVLLDEDTFLIVIVTQQDGRPHVVGGAFAWRDITYLKRNGRDVALNTYEISGATIRREYRGRGLYKVLSVVLLTRLAQLPEPVDVVFDYLNLREPAVLAVAAQTSRVLVTETASRLHIPLKPTMQLYTVNGSYVDSIVTYIPGERLRKLYGAGKFKV